ncbi:MAG: hypothetical protein HQ495_07985 [Alphaproteobacteria bacterium]|nr:hypothetical protein [Alphaproteobacteria bacterium]
MTYRFGYVALTAGLLFSVPAAAADFSASLADGAWDGRAVPKQHVCQRFGGAAAMSPRVQVSGIPSGAAQLEIWFNDTSFAAMDSGGHGKVRFKLAAGAAEAVLEPIPGETSTLPSGYTTAEGHRGSGWSGTTGAYLPPCSGGRGNLYTMTIFAVDDAGKPVSEKMKVVLGTF